MKMFGIICLILLGLGSCVVLNTVGWLASRSVDVAKQELDPAELLRKYEWFKDASATLDKKNADIQMYTERVAFLQGLPRDDMDRADKEQLSIWQTELLGVRASYNLLAAEYNSQMAKINWAFTNVGDLPSGATQVLPREFRTYEQ